MIKNHSNSIQRFLASLGMTGHIMCEEKGGGKAAALQSLINKTVMPNSAECGMRHLIQLSANFQIYDRK